MPAPASAKYSDTTSSEASRPGAPSDWGRRWHHTERLAEAPPTHEQLRGRGLGAGHQLLLLLLSHCSSNTSDLALSRNTSDLALSRWQLDSDGAWGMASKLSCRGVSPGDPLAIPLPAGPLAPDCTVMPTTSPWPLRTLTNSTAVAIHIGAISALLSGSSRRWRLSSSTIRQ